MWKIRRETTAEVMGPRAHRGGHQLWCFRFVVSVLCMILGTRATCMNEQPHLGTLW